MHCSPAESYSHTVLDAAPLDYSLPYLSSVLTHPMSVDGHFRSLQA